MRMRRSEDGAIAVLIAISMLALMGVIVIVVDVGGLLTTRRRMVTAADSAALAAAQSCAQNDAGNAPLQANALAQANVSSALNQSYSAPGCGTGSSGTVTVKYSSLQKLFFAPLLGADDTESVPASATAIWAPAGTGSAAPLSATGGTAFPCAVNPPQTCNFWFDNGTPAASSTWGFVSFDTARGGWPADLAGNDPTRSCSAAGSSTILGWMGGVPIDLVANPADTPTYVCMEDGSRGGGQGENSQMGQALIALEGKTLLFPVNDPSQQPATNPGAAKYAIVGFIPLLVTDVINGRDPAATGSGPGSGSCGPYEHDFGPAGLSAQFDYSTLLNTTCRLVDAPANAVINPTPRIRVERPNGTTRPAVLGTDYALQGPGNRTIRWIFPSNQDPGITAQIFFDYTTPAVPGACLDAPAGHRDPNAWCLVTTSAGPIAGGANPMPGAPDFGVRAFRLSG